jgi:hypothetical protein
MAEPTTNLPDQDLPEDPSRVPPDPPIGTDIVPPDEPEAGEQQPPAGEPPPRREGVVSDPDTALPATPY